MAVSQQIRNPTVAVVRNPVKLPSPITGFCFSMSCRSLIAACWRCCESRWSPGIS